MQRETEEIMEAIWTCEEQQKNSTGQIRDICHVKISDDILETMQKIILLPMITKIFI